MATLLHQAIHQFVGCNGQNAGPEGNGSRPPSAMLSLNLSKKNKHKLASHGYPCHRSFVALPSLTSTRWLFPLANGRCTLAGLEAYTPHARTARILKAFFRAVVKSGCPSLLPHRLLLASSGPLPLEDLVREVTGECNPVFALSVGTEARFRKLTVQVMRPQGEILGHIKLPLTDAAVGRVRHEAEALNHLWTFPSLRPHIPRVLYSGEWSQGYMLFQSGGPATPGPVHFDRQCEDFLRILRGIHPTEKAGHVLWNEVAARWQKAEPNLSSGWRALGQATLARAKREVEGVTIPCGVSHGDFTPWNTRLGDQGLYVFDWESASWDAPSLWDIFHFRTQVAASLGKNRNLGIWRHRHSGEPACYLLYLLNSAGQLFLEDSPKLDSGLKYRRQLIEEHLGGY